MYSWIGRNIFAKMLDIQRGTETIRCLNRLEKSQWWSLSDILELQRQSLHRLISYVYENTSYYNRIFRERSLLPKDINKPEDLVKLPELNKQIVRNNFSDLQSRIIPVKKMIRTRTSGTTGEPFIFYSTKEDQMNRGYARAMRAQSWSGYKFGDKSVSLREAREAVLKEGKVLEYVKSSIKRTREIDTALISSQSMAIINRQLNKFAPRFLSGYPDTVYLLARFLESNNEKPEFKPAAIITGGEQLYKYQRSLIEKVFGCRVYDWYSSWEVHDIACECSEHKGLHIAAEDIILEVVDDAGKPLPPGKEGRILLTNLHNYAMPLIRYDIGDFGVLSNRTCDCGRGLPLLEEIKGRICDVIITKTKGVIPGMSLPWDFMAEWGVEQFQVVQNNIDEIVVNVVLPKTGFQRHLNGLTREIITTYVPILGEDMDISVEPVDNIHLTGAGKRKFIISKVPLPE